MKKPDGNAAVPSSPPPDDSTGITPDLEDVRTLVFDAQYQRDRISAVLRNTRELLMLTGMHADDAMRPDPINLAHGLPDALSHLKVLSSLLEDLEVMSHDARPRVPEDRRMWHTLRRRWSACNQTQRGLILETMKTLEGDPRFRRELTQCLRDQAAK